MKKPFLSHTIKPLIIFLLFAGIFIYIFFSFAKVPSDSDFATLTLEADEMLRGNFFLKGWNLTGAAFTYTELPFYMAGVLVFGVDPKAFILANSLMVTSVIFLSYLLLPPKRSWLIDAIYFALTALPTPFLLQSLRGHAGMFLFSFIGFFLIKRLQEDHSNGKRSSKMIYLGYILFLALGTASDVFILPILAMPVILISLQIIIANDSLKKRFSLRLIFYTVIGVVLGIILEKGYFAIGGANLNARTDIATFNALTLVQSSFMVFVEGLLRISGAYAPAVKIFSLAGIILLLKFLLLSIMVVILFMDVIAGFKRPRTDPLSSMIATGMVVLTFLLLIAPFLYILEAARYFSYFPFAMVILMCRWIHRNHLLDSRIINEQISVKIPVMAVAAFLLIASFHPISIARTPTPQDRLATYLEENGLTYGYADFWHANHTVVSSNAAVRVAALTFEEIDGEVGAHPYYWFSKDEWYEDPRSNFVVVAEEPYRDMTVDNVIRYLGIPNDVRKIEGYTILIYDPGLSDMLTKKKL